MKKLLVIATILLGSLVASAQTQYFVNTATGSDSNNGLSSGASWKTIGHAMSALSTTGGYVVNVSPGTYNENLNFNRSGPSTTQRGAFKCTGQWTVPSSGGCRLRGVGGTDTPYQINANNLDIGGAGSRSGFDVSNTSSTLSYGITSPCNLQNPPPNTGNCNTGNSVHVLNNWFHDLSASATVCEVNPNGHPAIAIQNRHGPFLTDLQIIGNRITNIGPQNLSALNGGPGCINYYGMYIDTQDAIVESNIIINVAGYGIHYYSSPCHGIISGNTVLNTERTNIIAGGGDCNNGKPSGNFTISDNILGRSASGQPHIITGVPGGSGIGSTGHLVLVTNNLFVNDGNTQVQVISPNFTTIANSVGVASLTTVFAGYTGGNNDDLHLKAGSPAVGSGSGPNTCAAGGIIPCVNSLDFDGLVRPNPPSRGAYELTSGGGTPASSISPTSWDFGNVTISTPSAIKLFTYASTGTASVTQLSNPITGPNAADFQFGGIGTCNNGTSYPPGNTCTISLKFVPSTITTETATMTVTDNGSTSPLVVTLTGTGRPGSGGGGTASLSLSQSSVVFTYISVNTDAAGPVITASNVGTASMLISNITFADSTNWHATSTCIGVPVAPGGNCKITPFLKPLSAGAKATTMTILSNATESPTTVSLSGTAVQSNVGASPSSLTFSDTPIGSTTPSQNVTVSNTAANAQARLTINLTGPYSQTNTCSAGFSDTFSSGSLNPALWVIDGGGAPGTIAGVNTGTFSASNVDMSQGALALKVTQSGSAPVTSIGAEVRSVATYGFGTYDWLMRSSSTATSPDGAGSVTSGQISSAFSFINGSETEIDVPEIEGQSPNTLEFTSWSWLTSKQFFSSTLANPEAAYHHYTMVWLPSSITFSVDGVVVGTNTTVVPQIPAYILMNHWGTNSSSFGGLATTGVTRWQYFKGFTFTPSSASIPAGGSCTISVAFQPTSNGAAPGSLQMTVPDGGPQPTIPLGGNGVIPTNGVLVIGGVKFQIGIQILK